MKKVAAVVKGKVAGIVSRFNNFDRCYLGAVCFKRAPKTRIIWGNK